MSRTAAIYNNPPGFDLLATLHHVELLHEFAKGLGAKSVVSNFNGDAPGANDRIHLDTWLIGKKAAKATQARAVAS